MDPIYLPQLLKSFDCTESIGVDTYLPGLETLVPAKGWIKVTHHGSYLEVAAQAQTIVTLGCDRCLQQYNHRLSVDTSELIWFRSQAEDDLYEPGTEIEVPLEELLETLAVDGFFNPRDWLYEQFCLEMPQRQLCDEKCEGIALPQDSEIPQADGTIDHRWAALESLRNQL